MTRRLGRGPRFLVRPCPCRGRVTACVPVLPRPVSIRFACCFFSPKCEMESAGMPQRGGPLYARTSRCRNLSFFPEFRPQNIELVFGKGSGSIRTPQPNGSLPHPPLHRQIGRRRCVGPSGFRPPRHLGMAALRLAASALVYRSRVGGRGRLGEHNMSRTVACGHAFRATGLLRRRLGADRRHRPRICILWAPGACRGSAPGKLFWRPIGGSPGICPNSGNRVVWKLAPTWALKAQIGTALGAALAVFVEEVDFEGHWNDHRAYPIPELKFGCRRLPNRSACGCLAWARVVPPALLRGTSSTQQPGASGTICASGPCPLPHFDDCVPIAQEWSKRVVQFHMARFGVF